MTAKDYTPLARHIQLASASERTGRPELPRTGGERATLTAFLDWHRETFALKCAGVATDRMSEKAVPPSG